MTKVTVAGAHLQNGIFPRSIARRFNNLQRTLPKRVQKTYDFRLEAIS
jgi:hypothetical protein